MPSDRTSRKLASHSFSSKERFRVFHPWIENGKMIKAIPIFGIPMTFVPKFSEPELKSEKNGRHSENRNRNSERQLHWRRAKTVGKIVAHASKVVFFARCHISTFPPVDGTANS